MACLPPPTPDQHGPIGKRNETLHLSSSDSGATEGLTTYCRALLLRAREEGQGTSRCVCPFLLTFQRQSQDFTQDANAHLLFFWVNETVKKRKKPELLTHNPHYCPHKLYRALSPHNPLKSIFNFLQLTTCYVVNP